MTLAIHTRQLTKPYGERRGVFDLDLDVEEGDIFGFLGPNGSGKSTTIRLLLDLIRPITGSASVFGHDCRHEATEVHRITGYLPGEFSLDPKLTGRQLITYLGHLRGGADRDHVRTLSSALDLDLDRPFREYSRGNKQKVGIVQAFMHRPRLLVLDEPTGGLDPLVQEAVLELVREARTGGTTGFFSSHILAEIEDVCDHVVIRIGGPSLAEHRRQHDHGWHGGNGRRDGIPERPRAPSRQLAATDALDDGHRRKYRNPHDRHSDGGDHHQEQP